MCVCDGDSEICSQFAQVINKDSDKCEDIYMKHSVIARTVGIGSGLQI